MLKGWEGLSNRVNPLRVGGLTPYTDSAMPAVYGGNNYRFYRQGKNTIITSPLYGKVDILTKAKDAQSNGSDIVGIYRIGYQVNDEEGNTILPYIENIKFDNVNGILNAVYGSESDISNYYYWVTKALSTNNCYRYWNTKLKSGQNWNGADAAINSQAGCPDGKYKVWVLAYDIRGNGGNMATHKGAESKDINIDNFVPYASCVEVDKKRGGRNKVYTGEWILDASGTKLELEIEKETALPGETLSVYIDFSEAMNKNNIDVKLSLNDGEDKIDVDPIAWTSKKTWTGEVIIPNDSSSLGEAIIEIISKDLTGNSLDNNPKTIGERDSLGTWLNYEPGIDINHKFYIGDIPVILQTDPKNDEEDVPIDKEFITIKFSKPMDKDSTEKAISIDSGIDYTTLWDDEKTIKLNIQDDTLEYSQEYTVTITDVARDTSGVKIDGDGDGNAGGDYEFKFKTEDPDISYWLDPIGYLFKLPGQDNNIDGNVVINGSKLKRRVDVNITKNVTHDISALSFNGGTGSFSLDPGDNNEIPYSVIAFKTGRIYAHINLKSKGTEKLRTGYFAAIDTSTANDSSHYNDHYVHPDENQSPGIVNYPTRWLIDSDSVESDIKVGIFTSGWTSGYGHILGKYNIFTIPVFSDLVYWKNPDTTLSNVINLLVIGSGALSNYNSPEFKQKLENYISGGGNLLVLDQKYGSDYSVLPDNIGGYGWAEDQSCFQNAGYLNEWYPLFSGQTRKFINCRVDGYFNQYSDSANVLLRRRKNGMPFLLSYAYGTGRITVSTLYSDWGYGHNQVSQEELKLIRDLTTWAMNPDMQIPEFYPDSNISVPVKIYYSDYDTIPAKKAIIKVYNPDRELYDSLDMAISLNYGEDTGFVWNHSPLPESLGLWTINYAILDSNNQYIQGYKRGAIFAQKVDIPMGNYNLGDYRMWVNSNTEEIYPKDTVKYKIFIKNNTDSILEAKVIIGRNPSLRIVNSIIDSIIDINIIANTTLEIDYVNHGYQTILGGLCFGLFEKNQSQYGGFGSWLFDALSTSEIVVRSINPFNINMFKSKDKYTIGIDTIKFGINANVNYVPAYLPCSLYINSDLIHNGDRLFEQIDTIVTTSDSTTKSVSRKLNPDDYIPESNIANDRFGCEVYYKSNIIKKDSIPVNFIVPPVIIDINLPDSFNYAKPNIYSISLSSASYIPAGNLIISRKDYYDSLYFSGILTHDTTMYFDYQPVKWYSSDSISVSYKVLLTNQRIKTRRRLWFDTPLYIYPIQAVSYNNTFFPGDTAEFKGWVKIKQGNLYGAPITGWIVNCPSAGDTLIDSSIINPGETVVFDFKTYIDTTLPFGEWKVYETGIRYLDYARCYNVYPGYKIRPPEANLVWLYNDTFQIDEQIPVTFTNPIKTTSKVKLNYIQLSGNKAYNQETGPGEVEVPPESSYTYLSNISQWTTGKYNLKINSEIVRGEGHFLDLYKNYGCPIFLKGVESGLSVNSNRDWYLNNEDIILNSDINNGIFAYTGVETLSVYPFKETTNVYSSILNYCDFYGVHTENDSLGTPISAVIDSFYSLHLLNRFYIFNYTDPFILSDGTENIWLVDSYSATLYTPDFEDTLRYFALDSIDRISDCVIKNGWLYIADMNKRKICKINTASGNMTKSWSMPDTTPYNKLGITYDDNNNVIVVDNLTKNLYKFDNNGNLLDTLNLPMDLNYGNIDFAFGNVYVSSSNKILTINNTIIDTFCESGSITYDAISIGDNGELAVLNNYGWEVILYSSNGTIKSSGWLDGSSKDLLYKGTDILAPGFPPGKGKKRDRMEGYIYCYREYGVDKGLIKFDPQDILPSNYTFVNYYPDDDPNGGNITYNGVYYNGKKVSLQSLLGSHYIPDICVEMFGDWHNSPVFRKLDFEVRELSQDSLIYRITHNINPTSGEHIQFTDILTDSLSQGEYAIFGNLYTNNNQTVNSNINYFSVIGNEVALIMHRDTNDVPAGWVFHPSIKVINPLPSGQENLHLIINSNDSLYIDTIFNVDSCSADSFPISVSPNVPIILNGELILSSGDTLRKEISLNVIAGDVTIDVNVPEYVDFEPFEIENVISNNSGIHQEIIIKRRISTDSLIDTILIYPNDVNRLYDTLSTIESDTLYINVSGNFGEIEKKMPIRLGINCNLAFDTLYNVSPDSVEMSAVVRNEGVYPVNIKALFCLADSVQMLKREYKQIFNVARDVGRDITFGKFVDDIVRANIDTSLSYFTLNAGSEDTIPIMFDTHNPGNYVLQGFIYTDSLSIFLDSSQSNVNIIENSLISIDTIIVSEYCDSSGNVPVYVVVTNDSYNSFAGDILLSSSVCYLDTIVDIPSQKTDTIIFYLQYTVDEGQYPFTSQVRDGGISISEKVTDLEFNPIYEFNSIPDDYNIALGDSGNISLSVGNIGNAKGNRTISANWADVINLNAYSEIDPLSTDSFSQVFYIPNDMPGGEYFCNVSILNGYYPETDTFFKLWI